MWLKILITIILFYLFAVLQNNFFVHFGLFGSVPNLIFLLFFLTVFFEKKKSYYWIALWAFCAGIFLDLFSYTFFGVSPVLLLLIGLIAKKIQLSLKEKDEKFPLSHFLPLFIASFMAYDLLLQAYLRFFDPARLLLNFGWNFLGSVIYSLFFGVIGFFIYKKVSGRRTNV